ncbi:MAG: hypothetical protein ACXVCY_06180 [Pseudobdellovibrionaceae bacterium]
MEIYVLLMIIIFSQFSYADTCNTKNSFFDLDAVIDTANCVELPIGAERIVSLDGDASPTGVPHNYILERLGEKDYKVKLNLHFIENTLLRKDNTPKTQQIAKKVRDCVDRLNPHLIGPNGEKLAIEILNNDDAKNKSLEKIENVIAIDDDVRRAHSKYYGLNSSCDTIGHELLHLMGLTDEYKEPENVEFFQKDCRVLGPEDSIMSNHIETTDNDDIFSNKLFIKGCVCLDPTKCKIYSESQKDQLIFCPVGYSESESFSKFTNEVKIDIKKRQAFGYSLSLPDGFMNMAKQKEIIVLSVRKTLRPENSYLYPAQFRVITRPNCKKENRIYYSCAKDSYYRPLKLFGTCHSRPKECQDRLDWLR